MTQVRCPDCYQKFEIKILQLPLPDPITCPLMKGDKACEAKVKINVSFVAQHAKPKSPSRHALAQVAV